MRRGPGEQPRACAAPGFRDRGVADAFDRLENRLQAIERDTDVA
ncbi:hypothetical protein ABZ070_10670 [Streptomyces sp. NPDC006283]